MDFALTTIIVVGLIYFAITDKIRKRKEDKQKEELLRQIDEEHKK